MIKPLKPASLKRVPQLGTFANHVHPHIRFIWKEIIDQGVTVRSVADAAGVDPSTLHKWRRSVKGPTLAQVDTVLTALGYEMKLEKRQ